MKTSTNSTNLTSHQQKIFNGIVSMSESKMTSEIKKINIFDNPNLVLSKNRKNGLRIKN